MDADARESATECATIGDEPFVTLSSELRMQLASQEGKARMLRERVSLSVPGLSVRQAAALLAAYLRVDTQTV